MVSSHITVICDHSVEFVNHQIFFLFFRFYYFYMRRRRRRRQRWWWCVHSRFNFHVPSSTFFFLFLSLFFSAAAAVAAHYYYYYFHSTQNIYMTHSNVRDGFAFFFSRCFSFLNTNFVYVHNFYLIYALSASAFQTTLALLYKNKCFTQSRHKYTVTMKMGSARSEFSRSQFLFLTISTPGERENQIE